MSGEKLKILILAEDYPSKDNIYALMYIHTRIKIYLENGLDVEVLSFSAKESYLFEGVNVFKEADILKNISTNKYNLIISHAPNLRNHIRFINKNNKYFNKIIFFIHGHEVLKKSNYYPEPFFYNKPKFYILNKLFNDIYDKIKLRILESFIKRNLESEKLKIIFVSEWMKDAFLENIKIPKKIINNNSVIISNTIGKEFIQKSYNFNSEKSADFITIRPFDDPKYGVDIVTEIAKQNPDYSFHLYGKGKYFDYNKKPDNLTVYNRFILNDAIPDLLDRYRAAIIPTRLDSQGVIMCETATYGIPLITSNLDICREMLKDFNNIAFIDNKKISFYAKKFFNEINTDAECNKQKFDLKNTVTKEIDYINRLLSSDI